MFNVRPTPRNKFIAYNAIGFAMGFAMIKLAALGLSAGVDKINSGDQMNSDFMIAAIHATKTNCFAALFTIGSLCKLNAKGFRTAIRDKNLSRLYTFNMYDL